MKRTLALTLAGVVALGTGAGIAAATGVPSGRPAAGVPSSDPAAAGSAAPALSAARTALPGYTPATAEPDLPGLRSAKPAPGTVAQVAGPFDDRFTLEGSAFDGTAVTTAVQVSSDVSDLLALQLLAGFYDASGALIGTARFDEDHAVGTAPETEPPSSRHPVRITVPAELAGRAVSAAVGVTVLVNE